MSDEDLLAIYRKAWDLYYSPEHVERVIRRAKAWGYDPRNMMIKLLVVPRRPAYRERASAGRGHIPAQVPPRPPPRDGDRRSVRVLHSLRRRNRVQAPSIRRNVLAALARASARRTRCDALHRRCDDARGRQRVRRDADVHGNACGKVCRGETASAQGRATGDCSLISHDRRPGGLRRHDLPAAATGCGKMPVPERWMSGLSRTPGKRV